MHRTAKEIKMMNEQCPHIVGMSTCPKCDEERITELERALAILTSEEVENMALGAAERITELECEVSVLKESVRWIPVSEPPECGEKVLIPAMFGEVEIVRYLNGKWYDNNGCLRVNLSGNPLPPKVWRHMPLPPVEPEELE